MKEADLYPDLKAYLEGQGYVVKAEIGACDILARRGDEPPVVVEMKISFSLGLVMQGIARQALFDDVYLAVPVTEKGWKLRYKDIVALCRRLGLGLLAVKPGQVEAHLDPGPYSPRKNAVRAGRLLREFERRVGDPNTGGTTGIKRVTAYRQDALRCLVVLTAGPMKASEVAKAAGVVRAAGLMRADHYGWFERVSVGIYALTPQGRAAIVVEAAEIARLGGDSASV
ncbi:DUF2161 family putative PD-(D/E)XK-type phosphodiesterase [Cypionkella sp.]|uniref:DUF2161 family putative PD-(D/E)XK-type phosphodiesterase n=1 Tax=Cypionkella sp. TaxID=2811411 RepID=UPI002AB91109|nr:DUF2161 family putative PD-(D/E)XK-type phosphodiesterase [Cypionkella sp.]MDZ4394239.1 DUF2161 family putative PD-(D/E)XK-type phosphodiesterase [Cypionkella sp.]